jgi:uncharacterized protein (TIGR02147 family)
MPDIYQYTDYRKFLQDYFVERKTQSSTFSHQFFARKAGIKSSGFMLHVMKGQRNLTKPVLLSAARAIGLNAAQTEYFEDLISFDQAKTQSDREYYFSRISAKRKHVKIKALDDRQYEFYSAWYHSVIRELVTLTYSNDIYSLSKLLIPSITPKQVKDSLKLQEELGILKKEKNGRYKQAQEFVSAGGPVRNTALVKYQKDMLEQTKAAWDRFKADEITMHTVTLSMSEELIDKIRQEIRDFKSRLLEIVGNEDKKPERVFHLNINLFPVTKTIKGKEL